MFRFSLVLTVLFVARAAVATPQPLCDPRVVHQQAETARFNIIAAVDGVEAIDAWRHVLDHGGAVAWTATEYNVDARSTFLFAFDREALRVYRAGAFRDTGDAMDGCIDPMARPEAVIPWSNVREIEAGNWVMWLRLRQPVEIRSDRGKRKTVRELKAFFHGAPGGTLTYHYNVEYTGRVPFWNFPVYEVTNLRGIAVGPTDFQRRMQFVIAKAVDPQGRIALEQKGRGAGW